MIAIEQALPKKYVLACIMAFFALGTSSLVQAPNNETTMANIHRHLSSTMRRTYNEPLLFVGVIDAFGPIYTRPCKEAVGEAVDFKIERVILGTPQTSQLRASYINCTGAPLPAPPFTLRGRVIVYCEQRRSLNCLTPVEFSEPRLAMVGQWLYPAM
jgi:hypothetical protein